MDTPSNMGRKATKQRTPLGQHLLNLRVKAGLSQDEAAAAASVSQNAISRYEVSGYIAGSDIAAGLARAYGVSLEELLGLPAVKPSERGVKGDLRKVFEEASQLPRSKQKQIAAFVKVIIAEATSSR